MINPAIWQSVPEEPPREDYERPTTPDDWGEFPVSSPDRLGDKALPYHIDYEADEYAEETDSDPEEFHTDVKFPLKGDHGDGDGDIDMSEKTDRHESRPLPPLVSTAAENGEDRNHPRGGSVQSPTLSHPHDHRRDDTHSNTNDHHHSLPPKSTSSGPLGLPTPPSTNDIPTPSDLIPETPHTSHSYTAGPTKKPRIKQEPWNLVVPAKSWEKAVNTTKLSAQMKKSLKTDMVEPFRAVAISPRGAKWVVAVGNAEMVAVWRLPQSSDGM